MWVSECCLISKSTIFQLYAWLPEQNLEHRWSILWATIRSTMARNQPNRRAWPPTLSPQQAVFLGTYSIPGLTRQTCYLVHATNKVSTESDNTHAYTSLSINARLVYNNIRTNNQSHQLENIRHTVVHCWLKTNIWKNACNLKVKGE